VHEDHVDAGRERGDADRDARLSRLAADDDDRARERGLAPAEGAELEDVLGARGHDRRRRPERLAERAGGVREDGDARERGEHLRPPVAEAARRARCRQHESMRRHVRDRTRRVRSPPLRSVRVRVGIGYDIHPFDPLRPLVLGGVRIDGAWGLRGHSDADVLLHAIGDACLGAACLGDLGDHFPDADPQWRGAPSAVLLARILELLRERRLAPTQVDATVVAERPRVAPHREAIRERLASILSLPLDRVSVKASTNNGIGAVGRAEGIAAIAIVTLDDVTP
jgi:2-C-methyl-D-erythritol 2,4-cyclodiphosphate synthase